MKYDMSYYIGAILAVPIAIIVGFISMNFFALDNWIDWSLMVVAYIGTYIPVQWKTSNDYLREQKLTRREFKYVRKHLNESKPKIKTLLSHYTKVRSIADFKQVNEINRLARTIYKTVQKDPNRFFKVDSFFFSHLDNAVNLVNQYVHLVRMPHKSAEERNQINAAKITLEELKRTLQADLRALTKDDYAQMSVEIDLAKINQTALPYEEKTSIPINIQSEEKVTVKQNERTEY